MLVMCQRFGDLFLFELVWQYSSKYNKGEFNIMATFSSNITLSLPSYTALKRELNFCNGYLSLLYFCLESKVSPNSRLWCSSLVSLVFSAHKTENILNKETTRYRPNFFHLNESSGLSYLCGIRI
jgi:hypothetical protein